MTHEERMELTYKKYPHLRPDSWKSKSERKISEILQSIQDDLRLSLIFTEIFARIADRKLYCMKKAALNALHAHGVRVDNG